MERVRKLGLSICFLSLALVGFLLLDARGTETGTSVEKVQQASAHFDGNLFFNPGFPPGPASPHGQEPRRGSSGWIWRWLFGTDWPEWPEIKDFSPGPPPVPRVPKGALRITPVGHSTFLVQMDELNILIDPIWSNRCSPVSWAGPKRRTPPGIRFEDLPPIDLILVSHNHYDHLDLPTLKRLAKKGTPSSIVTLGNLELVRDAGIPNVDALDWWQSVRLSPDVTVTLVPAQHFSSRTLWDRNKTLWGGICHLRSIGKRLLLRRHGLWASFPRNCEPLLADPGGTSSYLALSAATIDRTSPRALPQQHAHGTEWKPSRHTWIWVRS